MLDKKTDILLAARKLFSEKDFTSVSMQAIAEECKMSKASIYKLFQSKEDLLLELLSFNQKQTAQGLKTSGKYSTYTGGAFDAKGQNGTGGLQAESAVFQYADLRKPQAAQ